MIQQLAYFFKQKFTILILLMVTACTSDNIIFTQETIKDQNPAVENNVKDHQKEVNLAIALPLTGDNTKLARQMLDAAQLAMYELKAENVNLIPINSSLPSEDFEKQILDEKIDIILGPMFSSETLRHYEDTAKKHKICMISYSNDSEIVGKDCLFLIGVAPQASAVEVIKYTLANKFDSIHAILPNSRYGVLVEDAIARLPAEMSSKVKVIGRYNDQELDYDMEKIADNITHFSSPKSTALFIPEGKKVIQSLKPKLLKRGGKLSSYKLLGSGMWENSFLIEDPDVDGAWFASPPIALRDKFYMNFAKQFGYIPSTLTTLAYDSIALIKVLATDDQSYGVIKKEELLNPYGFRGVTGVFKFERNGSNTRKLSIYEIKNNSLTEIKASDEKF